MNNKITNSLIIFMIVYFLFFAGCVGKETTIPIETPINSKSPMPTSITTQTPNLTETLSPTVTQTRVIDVTSNESDIIPNSEYEVYSSAISSIISSDFSRMSINKIVLYQLTSNQSSQSSYYSYDYFENLKKYYNHIMIEDYKNKNFKAYKLENKFSIPQTVILFSREELNNMSFGLPESWEAFYEKYPNSAGVFFITRAGFDGNQTQATLGLNYQAGSLWGKSYRIYLIKDEGKWKVKEQGLISES